MVLNENEKSKKITLKKLQITKLNNLISIKGGGRDDDGNRSQSECNVGGNGDNQQD